MSAYVETVEPTRTMSASSSHSQIPDKCLQFQTLLADLSTTFTCLSPDDFDAEIIAGLQRLVEFLGVQRGTLFELSSDTGVLQLRYSYVAPGYPPVPQTICEEDFPWYVRKLCRQEVIALQRLPEDLPPEAAAEKEYCLKTGFKANLVTPLNIGGQLAAALAVDSFSDHQRWPDELIQRLRVIGEVFANALVRKRIDEELSEGLKTFRTMFQNAPVAMLLLDGDRRIVRMNNAAEQAMGKSARDLSGVALGNAMDCLHSLEQPGGCGCSSHCTDCPVQRIVRDTFETGQEYQRAEAKLALHQGLEQCDRYLLLSTALLQLPADRQVLVCIEDITERRQAEMGLREALAEIEQLKERLHEENILLREEIKVRYGHEEIVGKSDALRSVIAQAEQVAPTDAAVLLLGETGTGKELLARAIHRLSPRKNAPMIVVNCAAIPPALVEGELFGREAGAYTGAMSKQLGRFEVADGSTLFLDEIGELPWELQGKLLRAIEQGQFERLGSPKTISVDVRVIAATNRDLTKALRDGTFREDLYHRLSVFPIRVPPLRERQEDIPLLVWTFVNEFGEKMGKRIDKIPRKTMESLERYAWPGNVRELRNVIERAMILSSAPVLRVEIPSHSDGSSDEDMTLDEVERQHILRVLERTGWRVRGAGGAAEILGLKPTTLETRMAKLGIRRPGKASGMPYSQGNRKQ